MKDNPQARIIELESLLAKSREREATLMEVLREIADGEWVVDTTAQLHAQEALAQLCDSLLLDFQEADTLAE